MIHKDPKYHAPPKDDWDKIYRTMIESEKAWEEIQRTIDEQRIRSYLPPLHPMPTTIPVNPKVRPKQLEPLKQKPNRTPVGMRHMFVDQQSASNAIFQYRSGAKLDEYTIRKGTLIHPIILQKLDPFRVIRIDEPHEMSHDFLIWSIQIFDIADQVCDFIYGETHMLGNSQFRAIKLLDPIESGNIINIGMVVEVTAL